MTTPLRVLYITSEIPFPLTSGFLRHYHFMRALGQKHKLTYLSLTKKAELSAEARAALSPFVESLAVFGTPKASEPWLIRHVRRLPLVGKKFQGALRIRWAAIELKHAVRKLVQERRYDVIMFSGKNTFPAIANLEGVPIVADCCDATSGRVAGEIARAKLLRKLWLFMRYIEVRRIEKKLVRKTPYLAFASRRDRKAMLGEKEAGEILPQAVDADFWRRKTHERKTNVLIFTGVMSYPPNHDAAMFLLKDILPRVRQAFPEIELIIAGRDPLPALSHAASGDSKIKLTGFVEDLRPYLEQATLYVAPIRFASGVQNKILEALAMQMPVITTPVVAEGLRLSDNAELPLHEAESAKQFAERIIDLLQNKDERTRLAQAARPFVENNFVWASNIAKLEKLWLTAARRQSDSPLEGGQGGVVQYHEEARMSTEGIASSHDGIKNDQRTQEHPLTPLKGGICRANSLSLTPMPLRGNMLACLVVKAITSEQPAISNQQSAISN